MGQKPWILSKVLLQDVFVFNIPQFCKHFNRFAGLNLSPDPRYPKCIYKIPKNYRVKKAEKSLEISAFLVFSCLYLKQTSIM